jgi:hypothetical protein
MKSFDMQSVLDNISIHTIKLCNKITFQKELNSIYLNKKILNIT